MSDQSWHGKKHALWATHYCHQSGVTLIEVAVVMVILGLLVGSGILIGMPLVQGARAKDVMAIANDLAVAVRNFKDRYHYLPGDLPDAAKKIPGVSAKCDYNRDDDSNGIVGNGVINAATVGSSSCEGSGNCKGSEVTCFSEHLSNAGFVKSGSASIRSYFGAVRVISRGDFAGEPGAPNLPNTIRNVIVFANLPLAVAREVDRSMDDGNLTTGRFRASSEADPVPLYVMPL